MPTDIGNIPPSTGGGGGGGGAATLPSTLVLDDAGPNTAPDMLVLRHTVTPGPATSGIGDTIGFEAENGGGATVRFFNDTASLVNVTPGSEEGQRLFSIMQAGTMRPCFAMGFILGANIPTLFFQNSGNGIIYNGGTLSIWHSGNQVMQWLGQQIAANQRMVMVGARFCETRGAAVASATTVTLGADGNLFGITGTTTINGITTTNWNAGSRVTLELPSGIVITHNSGAPGGGAVAIQLRAAANLTTTAVYFLDLIFNGLFWTQPG